MPDTPRGGGPTPPRGAPATGIVGGAALGLGVGVLGTATHLNVLPFPAGLLPGGWTLPWGAVLALVLVGSAQRWWMRRTRAEGGRPVPAGAAVAVGAFTAASALQFLPGTDRLGLPWSPGVFTAMPGAALASLAWVLGLPLVGVAGLVAGARGARGRREYPGADSGSPTPGTSGT